VGQRSILVTLGSQGGPQGKHYRRQLQMVDHGRAGVPGAGVLGSRSAPRHASTSGSGNVGCTYPWIAWISYGRILRSAKFADDRYRWPMTSPGDVPPEILDRLRPICRRLPEAYEEPAWIGVRWRVRTRTFAHVYAAGPERYAVYADLVPAGAELIVMTFRVPVQDLLGLTAGGFPFFRADWGQNVAAAVLGEHTDWTEIEELITDSFCEMAPKFLVTRLTPSSPSN
jgi:hypothetical protein